MQRTTLAMAMVLVLATVAVPVAAQTTTTVDDNHQLASDEAITEFKTTGNASADLTKADMTVTVSKSHDGVLVDSTKTFLTIDYREDLDRTVRLYIPSEYFSPRVKRSLSPMEGGTPISLTPVKDGEMTAVSIELTGAEQSTYVISSVSGSIWSARSWGRSKMENATGFDMPTLASDEQWQYVDGQSYSAEYPATINSTSATVQYQSQTTAGDIHWLPVPECNDPATQRVCRLEDGNKTIVMSSQDSPRLRHKDGRDPLSDLSSALNDLSQVNDRIMDKVNSIFGGGS